MKGNKHKKSTTGRTNTSAIAIGVAIAILLSALLTAGVTSLVLKGSLRESVAGAVVFLIRGLSVLAGALVAGGIKKGKYLQITGFTALGYMVILLGLGIALYDGSFFGGVISVLLGGAVALLIQQRPKSGRHKTAKYSR